MCGEIFSSRFSAICIYTYAITDKIFVIITKFYYYLYFKLIFKQHVDFIHASIIFVYFQNMTKFVIKSIVYTNSYINLKIFDKTES